MNNAGLYLFNGLIQFNRNTLSAELKPGNFKENFSSYSWSIGARYILNSGDNSNYRIGVFYEKGDEIAKTFESGLASSQSSEFAGFLPDKLHLGFLLPIFSQLNVIGNISDVFWSNIPTDSRYPGENKDQIELSGSLIYQPSPPIKASLGFFFSDRQFDSSATAESSWNDKYRVIYLSGGIVWNYK